MLRSPFIEDHLIEFLALLFTYVVPVYYGAYNVLEHVPPNSVIDANAFNSSDDLAAFLNKVAGSKTLYEKYHEWRTKPLPEAFLRKYNFTREHSTCRTCRWAFAKKYGLGWDHETQNVQNLHIPRKLCHDADGVLTHPFQETWLSGNGRDVLLTSNERRSTPKTCHLGMATFTTVLGEAKILRKVRSQDGATDIFLDGDVHSLSDGIILRMGTSIADDATADALTILSERHFRFQDATKRITILTNIDTTMKVASQGVLELHIPRPRKGVQVRTIIEDVDTFYLDGFNRTNYFGQLMSEDFLNPLEKFVVWGRTNNVSSWDGHELTNVGILSTAEEDDGSDDDRNRVEQESRQEAIKGAVAAMRRSLAFTRTKTTAARDKR
jgi:Glycosyltransferase family 10 (fucosyltransferase) C-term